MADTTFVGSVAPDWTVYTQISNVAGEYYNGSTYAAYSVGNWTAYATTTPETSPGIYTCQFPITSPVGQYTARMFRQLGASPASTDPPASQPLPFYTWDGTTLSLGSGSTAPINPSPVDLITSAYATQVLAAGGITLSTAQAAIQATLITAASREIIRYCSRQFALTSMREIVTPEGTRQDRGEPASAKLSAFPVQSVASVLTGRSTVLTITNTDTSTNQFASVTFSMTGDVEYHDLVYTGVTLSRTASGVTTSSPLLFADYLTLQSLADAVNALGNGWSATVQSSYTKHPTASLVGVREPKDALSTGAGLDLFAKPASSFDIDRATGIMRCYGLQGSGFGAFGGGYGDPAFAAMDGLGGFGGYGGWGQYEVSYSAGWAVIPENLQQVCAEVVKGMYARLSADSQHKSMSGGSAEEQWSWTARDVLQNLPDWAQSVLGYYRSYSV